MPINPTPINDIEPRTSKKGKNNIEFLISEPIYTFSDMVIDENLKNLIMDAISIFEFKDKVFDEWKLSKVIKKPTNICINFYGEPGTGKTMAANAIASELGLKIIKVNYADIESKYVGETSKNLVKLFNEAKKKNTLILFDEADALLSRRVTDMNSATDVSVNQTRSVLLTLLDSFEGMVIFTTNFISNYDPAFMRRIPYHIHFNLPNERIREELLEHYLLNTVPNNIQISQIAQKYDGISGCDIANATLTTAIKTARDKRNIMQQSDFEEAIKNILYSKKKNKGEAITVETRHISEDYAYKQIEKTRGGI